MRERERLCDGPHVCGPNGHFSVRLKRAEASSTQLIFTIFFDKTLGQRNRQLDTLDLMLLNHFSL